jgi:hypothetical protein
VREKLLTKGPLPFFFPLYLLKAGTRLSALWHPLVQPSDQPILDAFECCSLWYFSTLFHSTRRNFPHAFNTLPIKSPFFSFLRFFFRDNIL